MSEQRAAGLNVIRLYMYYFVIGITSFIALVFIPMVGSELQAGWNLPNTLAGWIVWVSTKLIMSTINVLIFHAFICQAKINVKDNDKYREALNILGKIRVKNYIPRSPTKFFAGEYGKKGIAIFISTALASVSLTQAILTFDWIAMLTYLFTIILGLIFGLLEMRRVEDFWTGEFYDYAKDVERAQNEQMNQFSVSDNPNVKEAKKQ